MNNGMPGLMRSTFAQPGSYLRGKADLISLNEETAMRTAATLTSIAVLTLGIINVADAADTAKGAKSLAVHFADLDLSKTEDAARLFRRLRRAARNVCEIPRLRALDMKRTDKTCVEFALANAIAKMDRPMLTQYAIDRNRSST